MNEPNAPTEVALSISTSSSAISIVAAQLEMRALEVPSGQLADCPARRSGAGEGDHPNVGMRHQGFIGVGAAGKYAQQTLGETGLLEDPGEHDPPQSAVRGSGLRTTALPSASAGATALIDRMIGKLNGAITHTTPTGIRREVLNLGCSERSTSPYGCAASSGAL
ncbi:hypothetical protein M2275_001880 [Rhodococcus opacus]|nr:hypothetical protein [Rhodococcus opacus]